AVRRAARARGDSSTGTCAGVAGGHQRRGDPLSRRRRTLLPRAWCLDAVTASEALADPALLADEAAARVRVRQGWLGHASWRFGLAISIYALYWVLAIVSAQVYRPTFLLLALSVAFLLYPARLAVRGRVTGAD